MKESGSPELVTAVVKHMEWQAWLTIAVTVITLIALAFDRPADLVFMGALIVLTLAGVVDFKSAFEGFISPSLLMVAALFVEIGRAHV